MPNSLIIHNFVSVELVNGILIGYLKSETVDLNIAKAAVNYRLDRYFDKNYPLLINITDVRRVTKDAREYLASAAGCNKVSSCAIITNSGITKVLANFFIRINKPLVPTKLFTSENAAKQWLLGYIN